VVAGFGLIVLGIFVLFGGLISQTPPLGIAGFVLALVGAVLAISNLGGLMNGAISKMNAPKNPKSGKWSSKFEERWDRRNLEE
jgi:disulfide bond formation protein DsbB